LAVGGDELVSCLVQTLAFFCVGRFTLTAYKAVVNKLMQLCRLVWGVIALWHG
jgi:hypothetical protein